ncbi:hypothetical protein ILYODFUR_035623 [Ilyodon furcidens]|uniref:Uncharacterized protein n=1 Tax=Ilyodon furcidens TaxID=33524 RepID=A0ABV0ULR3_9TELE
MKQKTNKKKELRWTTQLVLTDNPELIPRKHRVLAGIGFSKGGLQFHVGMPGAFDRGLGNVIKTLAAKNPGSWGRQRRSGCQIERVMESLIWRLTRRLGNTRWILSGGLPVDQGNPQGILLRCQPGDSDNPLRSSGGKVPGQVEPMGRWGKVVDGLECNE